MKTNIFKIGILGAGVMGSQIAILFAENGFEVKVWDIIKISKVKDGFQCCTNEVLSNITFTNDLAELNDVNYLHECIVEDMAQKIALYRKLNNIFTNEIILATNTSSLSIENLSREIKPQIKFAGIHFFNPVKNLKLVEIAYLQNTPDEIKKIINEIMAELHRKPILVSDSPGFIVNRLLIPMINEAINLLDDKIAGAKEIDSAMRLGANHPIGPLALADLIGLDVCLAIIRNLNCKIRPDYYKISPLLENYVAKGWLGKKVKRGIYEYE